MSFQQILTYVPLWHGRHPTDEYPLWHGRHPTDEYSISVQVLLSISIVKDATASMTLQCRLGRLLALVQYCTSLIYPHRQMSRNGSKTPQLIHMPVNCSMVNAVIGVQKHDGTPSCWKKYPLDTLKQHGSLACHLSQLFHKWKMVWSSLHQLISTKHSVFCYPIHVPLHHGDSEIPKCNNHGG
jgi:hypothetical protein